MSHLKLGVDVISAYNLIPKDGKGSLSSSVELYFDGQKFCTTIKEKDLNPVWNESFYINISDPSNLHNLYLDIFIINHDKHNRSRTILGNVFLTWKTFVPYPDAVALHYPSQKRGIFSRVRRGKLVLKVYTTDDPTIKFSIPTDDPTIKSSIPLLAVKRIITIPNHEASVNNGVTPAVMNTISSTVAHDRSETRRTFHHLPNPSHHQQKHHSSDPAESHHETKYGVNDTKPDPQPPQPVRMHSRSSSQPVDHALKETSHEASINPRAIQTVMNSIPSTVAHDKSETRHTFHHLPNPSHHQQHPHSPAPVVSHHATKYGVDEMKPEPQPPQLVRLYSASSSQSVDSALKETSHEASINAGAIPTVMNTIPNPVAHDRSETTCTFHHLPNQSCRKHHHHSSAPAVSHHATKYGLDEMKPEPQPPELVRMDSVSSSQRVDYALKETSPFLEGERVVGDRVNRATGFLVQSWHQASSTIKILLLFTSMGFHEILFPLLTWFWHLLFRVTSLQLLWVHDEKQVVPNLIRLKLMIDKESNRVLYAESDQDFVDILFSFLTLPMGTIIRLAEKRSGIGCMDNLYKSVENLDDKFLQTKACRTMLLKPKNAYEVLCKNLVLKIDDTDPAKHYTCSKFVCWGELQNDYRQPSFRLASAVKNSECICGRAMDKKVFLEHLQQGISKGKNVFVKETQSFVIADDLCITPSSMSDCHEMVQNLRVGNGESIEVMVITIGKEEVLQLLKNSFLSKTPMTDTFLLKEQDVDDDMQLFETQNNLVNPNGIPTNLIKPTGSFAMMKVKLLIDKTSDRVLCLEAEEDFLDIVLSFLTFPLGYMLKILRGHSCSLRSMDNLCRSVRQLDEKYLKLSKYRDMLLNPSLAPYFSCENQVLVMGEETSAVFTDHKCSNSLCSSSRYKKLRMMNPKLPGQVTRGGGFVKTPSSLLIYDDLVIRPCSPTSGILDLLGNNVRMSDTEIQEVEVGGKEVLALLVVSLTSKRVLNSVFRSRN